MCILCCRCVMSKYFYFYFPFFCLSLFLSNVRKRYRPDIGIFHKNKYQKQIWNEFPSCHMSRIDERRTKSEEWRENKKALNRSQIGINKWKWSILSSSSSSSSSRREFSIVSQFDYVCCDREIAYISKHFFDGFLSSSSFLSLYYDNIWWFLIYVSLLLCVYG